MRQTRAAGVGEASGEETAGQVGAVGPGAMGIVALAVVVRCARLAEFEQHEAATEGAGEPRRGSLGARRYRNSVHDRAAMRFRAERRPRRLMTGGTDEHRLGVVLSGASS